MSHNTTNEIFISYAREDKEFAQRLDVALREKGRGCWVDWEDIPLSADWLSEVKAGIENAETFLFVISPDSIHSAPCASEVSHAASHNKRIVPLLRRKPAEHEEGKLHPKVQAHNWVFFDKDEDFDSAFAKLNEALDTDLEHVRAHTRLLMRAREWTTSGGNPSLLLRGDDLKSAEKWLAEKTDIDPIPTEQHEVYIKASRRAANSSRRARIAALLALTVFAGLTILALFGFVSAEQQRDIATANAAAAEEARTIAELERDQSIINAGEARNLSLAASSQVALTDDNTDLALALALLANEAEDRPRLETERALADAAYAPGTRALIESPDDEFVNSVAFHPEGSSILTGLSDGRVIAWDIATEIPREMSAAHPAGIVDLRYNWDGQLALSSSIDGTAILWEVETGAVLHQFNSESGAIWSALFQPGTDAVLISGENGTLSLYDSTTARLIYDYATTTTDFTMAAFSPAGDTMIVGAMDGVLRLYDVSSGEQRCQMAGHQDIINAVAFSPDGSYVASGSDDFSVRLWNIFTCQAVPNFGARSVGHTDWVSAVQFSADGRWIFSSGEDNKIIKWEAETGRIDQRFLGHDAQITDIALSPDGLNILSASADQTSRLWDIENGAEFARFPIQSVRDDTSSIIFSADSSRIYALEANGGIGVWEVETGRRTGTLRPDDTNLASFTFTENGRQAAAVTQDLRRIVVWEVETGSALADLAGAPGVSYTPSSIAISADGAYVAAADNDQNVIYLWDVQTGSLLYRLEGHDDGVVALDFYVEDGLLLSGSWDSTLILWDITSGDLLQSFVGHSDSIQDANLILNGEYVLSSSWDNNIFVWDTTTGDLLQRYVGHQGVVNSAVISPDDLMVLSASADGTVRVWDTLRLLELRRFEGHTGPIQKAVFSPDLRFAASVSRDNSLRLWHIHDQRELIGWVNDNRYVHPLSCEDRQIYGVRPRCNEQVATILTDNLAVRSRASSGASVLNRLAAGGEYSVLEENQLDDPDYIWYLIELPGGGRGWVREDGVEITSVEPETEAETASG